MNRYNNESENGRYQNFELNQTRNINNYIQIDSKIIPEHTERINEICIKNIDNKCKHGSHCRFVHGFMCQYCKKRVYNPYIAYKAQKIEHEKECPNINLKERSSKNLKKNSKDKNENDNKENENENKYKNKNRKGKEKVAEINIINLIIKGSNNSKNKTNTIIESTNKLKSKSETETETEMNSNKIDTEENKNNDNGIDEFICSICLENIKQNFGVLSNCNHYFCSECIKEWRNQHGNDIIENHLKCPICKIKSQFVIHSKTFPSNEKEHKKLVDEHRQELANTCCSILINCDNKYCPFGDDCIYSHYIPENQYIIFNNKGKRTEPLCPEEYNIILNQKSFLNTYDINLIEEMLLINDGDGFGMHNGVFSNPMNDINEDEDDESVFDIFGNSSEDEFGYYDVYGHRDPRRYYSYNDYDVYDYENQESNNIGEEVRLEEIEDNNEVEEENIGNNNLCGYYPNGSEDEEENIGNNNLCSYYSSGSEDEDGETDERYFNDFFFPERRTN